MYTSMPDRGLDVLAMAAPHRPRQTHFDIYSAMRTYRIGEGGSVNSRDAAGRSRTANITGRSAKSLAQAMKRAAFFAYPSTFDETFCISAAEAIAAGLKVIATDRGALRETTLGYADLIPPVFKIRTCASFAARSTVAAAQFGARHKHGRKSDLPRAKR